MRGPDRPQRPFRSPGAGGERRLFIPVQHNWLIALERLRAAGAVVTSTEMAIYELLRKAGTDEFKATLPLVK